MITVTKKFNFCYGHRLPGYNGPCARFHGHNAEVEAEFKSNNDPEEYPTMIIDFRDIKKHVGPIIDSLDHMNLTETFGACTPATCETITNWIAAQIIRTSIKATLIRVRVTETPDSWAEWRAE